MPSTTFARCCDICDTCFPHPRSGSCKRSDVLVTVTVPLGDKIVYIRTFSFSRPFCFILEIKRVGFIHKNLKETRSTLQNATQYQVPTLGTSRYQNKAEVLQKTVPAAPVLVFMKS